MPVASRPERAFASESDWVSAFLMPRLDEAAAQMQLREQLTFHNNETIAGAGPKGGDGRPDLTVRFSGRRCLAIEAKFIKKVGPITRPIDPRNPEVVDQAERYAVKGGFPFYATCNATRIVLFKLDPLLRPFERELASFDYSTRADWATRLFELSLELRPAQFKPLDQALVDALHEAHQDLAPEAHAGLLDRLQRPQFSRKYHEWLETQGLPFADATHGILADQVAHLWIDRLLLYAVVQAQLPRRLSRLKISESEDVSEAVKGYYRAIVKIDYRAAYQPGLTEEIPLTERAQGRIRGLVELLSRFDFAQFKTDVLGRLYERLIPAGERKRLGQFYTPPEIVNLIVTWTIRNEGDHVLDPCCGSGGFLIGAYRHMLEQKGVTGPQDPRALVGVHGELLNQLFGIDVNQFASHLSILNLALQNPIGVSNKVNVIVKDFFDVRPGMRVLSGFEGLDPNAEVVDVEIPPAVDCVVGNPPYIRQELLSKKEKSRMARALGSAITLPGQSDIFAYFLAHGISFLVDGGRIGMITSNKWLEVGYGPAIQSWLLNNLAIEGIIEFDTGVFPDADVNTLVLLARREVSRERRDSNVIHFIRLKEQMETERVLSLLRAGAGAETAQVKARVVRQSELKPGKWNSFLREPSIIERILRRAEFRELKEIARVSFGVKTGYNDYFIMDKARSREFGIEPKFLVPVVGSPKDFPGLEISGGEIREMMFVCGVSKAELQEQGDLGALRFIEYGERLKVTISRTSSQREVALPNVPSLRSRKVWYRLDTPAPPPIILPELHDERIRAWWNEARAFPRAPLYYCTPKDEHSAKILIAYLNSSLSQLLLELRGRSYGGGVLDIKVREYALLPCLRPENVVSEDASTLYMLFLKLDNAVRALAAAKRRLANEGPRKRYSVRRQQTLFEAEVAEEMQQAHAREVAAQRELDLMVCRCLGFDAQSGEVLVQEVVRALDEQRGIRRSRKEKGRALVSEDRE